MPVVSALFSVAVRGVPVSQLFRSTAWCRSLLMPKDGRCNITEKPAIGSPEKVSVHILVAIRRIGPLCRRVAEAAPARV